MKPILNIDSSINFFENPKKLQEEMKNIRKFITEIESSKILFT